MPSQCSVPMIFSFLQDLLERDKAFSTVKVYLAAIAVCHVGFDGKAVGQHLFVSCFMKGACHLRPVSNHEICKILS